MTHVDDNPTPKPSQTVARLEQARTKVGWLSWAGFGLAIAWWLAGIIGAIATLGWPTITAAPPALTIAGLVAILLPGFILLMVGTLAREQIRTSATNAIVLEAAVKLLTPAEEMGAEATTFAQQMSSASADVDKSMGHALSAMRAMAGEIGDERQRLESVTYASADNARDLADRLGGERNALEQLTKDLREQMTLIGEAIPRQATLIVESAKAASDEVETAENALESRLANLEQVSMTLAQKIAAMDTLAAEAGQRSETLLFAIARMEEKLEQSRRTVETASRAGELAAAAAGTTGDRLMEAVRTALDGARDASAEIQTRSLEASESAARSLADLKDSGQQAAAAVRAAGMAARAEMDMAERRIAQANTTLGDANRTSPGSNGRAAPVPLAAAPAAKTKPAPAPPTSPPVSSPSHAVEEDLFEANADRMAQAMLRAAKSDASGISDAEFTEANAAPMMQRDDHDPSDVFDEDDLPPTNGNDNGNGGNSLSDIIADMEREERPTLSREETAEKLLDRLEDSGISLTNIFRPKDKKKIAFAARKGENQRRSAISSAAGRPSERVRRRLRGDSELMALARDFVALEESDALNALENTHGSNKNASARLATYLLLDAALN